jgi:hypothetical protein
MSRVAYPSPRHLESRRVPGADRNCGNLARRHDPRIGRVDRKAAVLHLRVARRNDEPGYSGARNSSIFAINSTRQPLIAARSVPP